MSVPFATRYPSPIFLPGYPPPAFPPGYFPQARPTGYSPPARSGFQKVDGSSEATAHKTNKRLKAEDLFARSVNVQQYARDFYQAMMEKGGPDKDRIKKISQKVHNKGAMTEFDQAIADIARKDGKSFNTAEELLDAKLSGTALKRWFKSPEQKEYQDYLRYGENRFRASEWEYRRYGMYRSIADFLNVCKRYPVMSAGVTGVSAYLGHKYPFLGGVSGIAIMAWGSLASIVHELKAVRLPGQSTEKAEHYVQSGENIAAVLVTALGAKGIKNGTINGIERGQEVMAGLPRATAYQAIARAGKGVASAITATSKEEHKTNLLESFLFVTGLLDNVLLPFNWLADKYSVGGGRALYDPRPGR